ncbi:MAG: T9SS type A sorting domain-containing protein [Candidatus Marinimicrobia bacterium]|nr:T9SS type A sorting domain-containing protein [Candidatus Neomarinimicrobiota bacterium]
MINRIILSLIVATLCYAQSTLTHDGLTREYYVSYPDSATDPCPLIINMHGYSSDALDQQSYSEMDDVALNQNIAVVYPMGIDSAWNVGTYWDFSDADDIGFISVLIDSVSGDYDIDLDRVYACGMSNGGYMAYELACELSDKIAAFGSVTGNFMLNANQTCDDSREIPFIHIHGTYDLIVPYSNSWDGSMFVGESIVYWRDINNLDSVLVESIPDIDPADNTTVEKYTYYNTTSSTQFVHFKVIGGGHQWFGSTVADWVIPWLGYNNHDINANEELIDFFLNYRLSDFLSMDEIANDLPHDYILHQNFPNPFNPITTIRYDLPEAGWINITIYDMLGREVKKLVSSKQVSGKHEIMWNGTNDLSQSVSAGVYLYKVIVGNDVQTGKMVLLK